jgi:hypothetical protein
MGAYDHVPLMYVAFGWELEKGNMMEFHMMDWTYEELS